ncbi:MAG: phosphoribosylglycinamide formyltransferase [Candidatus Muproteobacteria bacterium RBG_16_62_13]|uniref:Phosphoribosylglycinamide formyltransferase n=1 Tax=Candidatus Muproteobacteria bacterium RBG_16_62_13 TaxID=1817756 RepID=A0A1F6T137_9PROT|nr:MAG: phosphoribosylglycinamide formyltransferase [Candidatus Muproteobacteria bacterium RBG_16_62_13]
MTTAGRESGAGRPSLVVLISGRGSNLQAILDAIRDGRLNADLRAVISNDPDAPGLEYARRSGIPTEVVDHRSYPSREAFDSELRRLIDRHAPALVVLAGFMRILGDDFIRHYEGRLINIHPSLLPAFPGLNTHARALAAGVREHGATVHFVTPAVDAGPVIVQARVPVKPGDSPETLAERVLREEHRILPEAIGWYLAGRLALREGRVLLDGQPAGKTGPA